MTKISLLFSIITEIGHIIFRILLGIVLFIPKLVYVIGFILFNLFNPRYQEKLRLINWSLKKLFVQDTPWGLVWTGYGYRRHGWDQGVKKKWDKYGRRIN